MAKKIFALVLTVCVLGVMIGGCSKSDDTSGTATAGTAGTAGTATTGTTTGK